MKTLRNPAQQQYGFTLIEAIMVIVITGILGAIVAVFIARPVQGYTDTVRRAALADAADLAIRYMVRDVRLALPNSLRVDCASVAGWCYIEFISTSDGGRYRDYGDGSSAGAFLDFGNAANTSFDVLGPMPSLATNTVNGNGDYIVVYNLGPGYTPADAYQLANCGSSPGCNIAQVDSVSGTRVTLASNRFASQTPPLPSPNSRFQVVPYATRAVTYACPTTGAGAITRYWGYGLASSQGTPPIGGSSATVVLNANCTIGYAQNVQQRTALLSVQLAVADTGSSGERVTVFQQVHVDNSP